MLKIFLIIQALFFSSLAVSSETCSRIATINYQEVLIDSNASKKGEGLRYYLEKDKVAKEYLDLYQKNASVTWPNAVIGTAGTTLLLYGFFNRHDQDRNIFLATGAATLLVNFLLARTLEMTNEKNLYRAIDEYNKRNLPKINLNNNSVSLTKDWSF